MTEPMRDMSEAPHGQLILCKDEYDRFCLREFQGDDCYDENGNFDDSELEFIGWWELPDD
jgi:hypothetical protein